MSLAAENLGCGSVLAYAERLQVVEGDENLLLIQKKPRDFWDCNSNFVTDIYWTILFKYI
jgi:hypothetical protein